MQGAQPTLLQDPSFSDGSMPTGSISLPPLVFGPIRYPIGKAYQLLREQETALIIEALQVQISPKLFENCFVLGNSEKIILTSRTNIAVPEDIDGVIRILKNGRYEWSFHRLLKSKWEQYERHGLSSLSRRASAEWRDNFTFRPEIVDENDEVPPGNEGLRPPQLGALFSIGAHWSIKNNPATIVMPTGTGKTETMLAALAYYKCSPMVVATPTKALRTQTAYKFLNFGLLRKLGVLDHEIENPVVGIITRRPKNKTELEIFEHCNVAVGVISSLSGGTASYLANQIADRTNTLVLDEAHHVAATTWSKLREAYAERKVLQFTATPFRRDGKLVDGDVIYSYPLKNAQRDGYFKPITFHPVHELILNSADTAIAELAVSILNDDIENARNHMIMARCETISRAELVHNIYQKLAPEHSPIIVHSNLPDRDESLKMIKAGKSKIVVCVNMLGEGFDLPELKIAALHDSHKSLSVILQFIGRFTRSTGANLGIASAIANIADPGMSAALERLYSEDSDWNSLLSELSSNAVREHAELINFLNNSEVIGEDGSVDSINISHHLLRPNESTLFFHAESFFPKRFHEGLPSHFKVARVWINSDSKTLFFIAKTSAKVGWSKSKEIIETEWNLFVIHYDEDQKLLYLNSTDKGSMFESVAQAIGATSLISGEQIFRCLSGIGRLVFQNLGVTKHGRRNLSYAMYTGADVRQALSLSEKAGSRKSNLSGSGWEFGRQVNIGCSYKGRIWTRGGGKTIPEFIKWAESQGKKVIDTSINTQDVIDNVLIPDEVSVLPEGNIMGIEWPYEVIRILEEKLSLQRENTTDHFCLFDLSLESVDHSENEIYFEIIHSDGEVWGKYILKIGSEIGFNVRAANSDFPLYLNMGKKSVLLEDFFTDYPPLVRYLDLSELDGNLILRPENPRNLQLDFSRFEAWDWPGVDIRKESIWKEGAFRADSIQWFVAQKYISAGYGLVFDDDGAGEAADLICMNEEDNYISLVLIHCKYSGGDQPGVRIKDVVDVASQAIRSTKWSGRFKELCSHLLNRYQKRRSNERGSFILQGEPKDITMLSRAARFKEIKPQIVIVQPGLSKGRITPDQSQVLAAAIAYLKETINVDLDIVVSE